MTLKTYQAYTMAEALAGVKRDLGADAVILHTRTFKRRRLLGLLRRTIVEVTATPSREAQTAAHKSVIEAPPVKPKHQAALRAYGKANAAGSKSAENADGVESAAMEEDRRRTMRLAIALAEQHSRTSVTKQNPAAPAVSSAPKVSPPPMSAEIKNPAPPIASNKPLAPLSPAVNVIAVGPAPTARRFILSSPDKARSGGPPAKPASAVNGVEATTYDRLPSIASPENPGDPPVTQAMQDELAAIKSMVGQVLQRQSTSTGPPAPTTPPRLFDMYLRLIAQDISEELADQIVNEVRDELSADELEDDLAVREAVLRHLADFIPVATQPVLEVCGGRPLTIALVGPTGVGKTTTLAKLAASFKLRHGRNVGLVTADTYRIAAVEQLRTYANIIGLPLQVVLTPSEMRQAMHALTVAGCEVILVDTAGRSQNDVDRLAELKQFIDAANPHEVHLVLSSIAGERVLLKEAEAFSHVGADKIVFTKLDEAVNFGMLVNVIRQIGKQLSFVTTGQEVPDHLEVGRAERLAELVLEGGQALRRRPLAAAQSGGEKRRTAEGDKRNVAEVEIHVERSSSAPLPLSSSGSPSHRLTVSPSQGAAIA